MTKEEFLQSRDFMKIGQAINHESWQVAGLAARRLQNDAKSAGLTELEMNLLNLKRSIAEKNGKAAKDILAMIVAKRCKMMREAESRTSDTSIEGQEKNFRDNSYVVSAFSKDGTGGNKAGVVLFEESLSDGEKQSIAKKFGFSETAFVSHSNQADYKLEYYTPTVEVPLCGHATIATFSLLKQLGKIKEHMLSIETKAGSFAITVADDGLVMMQQGNPIFAETLAERELVDLVGNGKIASSRPITIVSTGLRDIMLPIRDLDSLENLNLNMQAISDYCKMKNVVGIHAFTLQHDKPGVDAVCRNFAPLYGIEEESATGTSNCALASYLFKNGLKKDTYVFEQGYSIGLPSRIIVKLETEGDAIMKVSVGGYGYLMTGGTVLC